jgi:hypothetical protein
MFVFVLNLYQVRWALFLFQSPFVITYCLRHHQRKLYALFCRLYFAPKEGNETYNKQHDVILKPEHLCLQA